MIGAVGKDLVALHARKALDKVGQIGVFKAVPMDHILVEERRRVRNRLFLTGIQQRHSLLKEHERRPAFEHGDVGEEEPRTGLVVIFEKTQLDIVVGIDGFLPVDRVGVGLQRAGAVEIILERAVAVVVIGQIKGAVHLGVSVRRDPLCAHIGDEVRLHGLAQPDGVGAHRGNGVSRLLPKRDGHQRRHVAAEAVYDLRPLHEGFDLIVP